MADNENDASMTPVTPATPGVTPAPGSLEDETVRVERLSDGTYVLHTSLVQLTGGARFILRPRTHAADVLMGDGSAALDRILLLERGLAANTTTTVVENIAERDLLAGKIPGDKCYVIDATDDPTVDAGGASYIWMPAKGVAPSYWRKLGEDESQDFALDWNKINGRPASAPGDIDAAVNLAHEHGNKPLLDALTTDAENRLCLNGAPVDDNRRELAFSDPYGPIPAALRDGGMLVVLEE